ncbi:hypothetical protein F2Q69_00052883 [Brassica cretica]|uniref:F-box domain-containing protein n=1 Tax=Brassica cretica TaxID=69181 RepID=A0A8S9MZ91_BRACR|nr:hypothetical protein F2Q69_00052883 [Brassica cretica]
MHPPNLKLMDATNGVRSCGESSFGKGKEISNNISEIELECVCYCQIKFNGNFAESYIVVIMAGRWIMYENGAWDFKIDNDRMGRTVDCSKIKGVDGLKVNEDDDGDYDYNYWHEYCRNDCVTDEDDDFEGSPPKRRGGGQSRSNHNWRSGPMSGRGQGSGKSVSGRGQRSSATGVSKSTKKACIRRHSEVNTDRVRDYICTSRTVGFAYTEEKNTKEGVDVVLLTPPKPNNQHNRVIEDDDDFVESVRSGDTGESVDVVLVTPPKQHNKHICVIEDDDEADDPPITECTPPKHKRVIEDTEEFVDPPVTQSTQVQGGESFMRGIQVSKMYGYNGVDPVFDEMRGSSFEPPEIDYTKEDSYIYVGRLFKDKAQFKLTMVIYALAKVCRFKLRNCKHFITAKCVSKQCSSWRVMAKQLGDSPTYMVKKTILGHGIIRYLLITAEFPIFSLPAEVQALVVQRVAHNSFADLYRVRAICKSMRTLADDGGVYAAFYLFKYPWYVGSRNLLLRRCFEEGNPSTLYVKGVEYFYRIDRHREDWVLWHIEHNKAEDMYNRCFWTKEVALFISSNPFISISTTISTILSWTSPVGRTAELDRMRSQLGRSPGWTSPVRRITELDRTHIQLGRSPSWTSPVR